MRQTAPIQARRYCEDVTTHCQLTFTARYGRASVATFAASQGPGPVHFQQFTRLSRLRESALFRLLSFVPTPQL